MSNRKLLQLVKEIPDRQHPLPQILMLQLNAQFIRPVHFDVAAALDHGDDLHRVDGRIRHELDLDRFAGGIQLGDAQRFGEDA